MPNKLGAHMARISRDGDPGQAALKGIFAGGELREGHSLASARTHHEAQRYALNEFFSFVIIEGGGIVVRACERC